MSLPLEHRVTPSGGESPDDDLLIVHATSAGDRNAHLH